MTSTRKRALPIALLALAGTGAAAAAAAEPEVTAAGRQTTTDLISRSVGGGTPERSVDERRHLGRPALRAPDRLRVRGHRPRPRRHQRAEGHLRRPAQPARSTTRARPGAAGDAVLVSRARGGVPAERRVVQRRGERRLPPRRPLHRVPLAGEQPGLPGDTNGKVDAFIVSAPGRAPQRVSPAAASSRRRRLRRGVRRLLARVVHRRRAALHQRRRPARRGACPPAAARSEPSYAHGQLRRPGLRRARRRLAERRTARRADGGSPTGRPQPGLQRPQAPDARLREAAAAAARRSATSDIGKGERIISRAGGPRGNGRLAQPGDRQLRLLRHVRVGRQQPEHRRGRGRRRPQRAARLLPVHRRRARSRSLRVRRATRAAPLPGGGQTRR